MFWGIFDTQQEKNEKIAKAAYLEGRNADGHTRFVQHVLHESKTDPSIYDKNFNRWEADRDKFGPLPKDNPPVTRSAPEVEETPSDDDSGSSCDEISEEVIERVASTLLSEALDNERKREEREREEDAARQANIERKRRRSEKGFDTIDYLYALSSQELEIKASWKNDNIQERELATHVIVMKKTTEEELDLNIHLFKDLIEWKREASDAMEYLIYKTTKDYVSSQSHKDRTQERTERVRAIVSEAIKNDNKMETGIRGFLGQFF